MLLQTRGIVLRAVKYGETSVIADILTEQKGLHSFIASGVRSAKSAIPYSLFQPMMVVECIVYFKEDPEALHRIKELRAGLMLQAIPFELKKGAVALFMAEICRKTITDVNQDPDLFDFIFNNIAWLDQTRHPLPNVHLHFLLHLSGLLGFQPVLEIEPDEPLHFDLKEGTFLPGMPNHAASIPPELTKYMLHLLHTPLEHCHTIQIPQKERKILLNKIIQFYQFHISGFNSINTPEILALVLES